MGRGNGGKIILHVKQQHMGRELETTKENNKKIHKELTNIKSELHGKKEKMDTWNYKR
jgi:Skp family chaperone for outer membrane proteins